MALRGSLKPINSITNIPFDRITFFVLSYWWLKSELQPPAKYSPSVKPRSWSAVALRPHGASDHRMNSIKLELRLRKAMVEVIRLYMDKWRQVLLHLTHLRPT